MVYAQKFWELGQNVTVLMNVPQILIALETKNAATMTVVENHVYQVQFQTRLKKTLVREREL